MESRSSNELDELSNTRFCEQNDNEHLPKITLEIKVIFSVLRN
jgi:hypothetical protein